MIIVLTAAFNFLHHIWDVAGVILLGLIIVFLPIAVALAAAIKIKEVIKTKLENKK